MRIAIFTLPLHTNYGGILQAYALQTILKRMGHEVVVINKQTKISTFIKIRVMFSLIFQRLIHHKTYKRLMWWKNSEISRLNTEKFIKKNITCKTIYNFKEIKPDEFNAFVVGSDQIWRGKEIFKQIDCERKETAYLSFTAGWPIKRISYAASLGTEEWEYSDTETNKCKNAIHLFDALSVREHSAIKLLKDKFDVDSQLVLDPTMLLSADDYKQLTKKNISKKKEKILVYILDENKQISTAIVKISHKMHKDLFYINNLYDNEPVPSVEDWLEGFDDATCIITDSFHACVFSIIFNKPFIVIGNVDRGLARIQSLLNIFNMEERLYTSFDDIDKICLDLSTRLTFSQTYKKMKAISLDFLNKNLNQ